jgi:hypothetical protein
VYNVKMRHKLVFFKPYSREPLAKFVLTDAMAASGKGSPKDNLMAAHGRHPAEALPVRQGAQHG